MQKSETANILQKAEYWSVQSQLLQPGHARGVKTQWLHGKNGKELELPKLAMSRLE